MKERTLIHLLENSVTNYPDNTAVWEKKTDRYESITYSTLHKQVIHLASALIELGIEKGDRIALLSEGRYEWVLSELAILYAGAINVPLSVKLDELSDLKFRLTHSDCRAVIVSGQHSHKIVSIEPDLAGLDFVILMDKKSIDSALTLQELIEKGQQYYEKNMAAVHERFDSIREDDTVNICYTSGTTADPKGIMLTHRNYTANVEQSTTMFQVPEDYVSLLILPWDHSFAHTAGIYTLLKQGASIASIQLGKTPLETLKNIPINIKETRPTFLLSVPALAKNFRKNIEKGIEAKGPKIEALFNSALKMAYQYNAEGFNKGKGLSWLKIPMLLLYDKLIFSKVREGFGGRLKFFVGGGALLDIELQRFFYAVGMPMYQGYGLTEAAPIISSNTPDAHKLGTSGKIVPNLEIKICDEAGNALPAGQKGEIVVKGDNVMKGYWKNEKATHEALRDGWLYTGDLGYLDSDGYLLVLGRFKSLLIGGDGEKYSPEGIEEAIVDNSNYIEQMMLYNNQSPYTVALVVPNKETVKAHLKKIGLDVSTAEGQTEAIRLIQAEIDQYKENGAYAGLFPTRWLPSAFALLGEGFTEQNLMMNSTLKIVRGKITEFYQSRIEHLYTLDGKDCFNHHNKNIVSRF